MEQQKELTDLIFRKTVTKKTEKQRLVSYISKLQTKFQQGGQAGLIPILDAANIDKAAYERDSGLGIGTDLLLHGKVESIALKARDEQSKLKISDLQKELDVVWLHNASKEATHKAIIEALEDIADEEHVTTDPRVCFVYFNCWHKQGQIL